MAPHCVSVDKRKISRMRTTWLLLVQAAAALLTRPASSAGLNSSTNSSRNSSTNSSLSPCPEGTYLESAATFTVPSSAARCSQCPANTFSGRGSIQTENCTCLPGFTGPDGFACQPCNASFFKNISGSAECTACPANTYSNITGATSCSQCPWNQTSPAQSLSIADCGCGRGYWQVNASGPCFDVDECANATIRDGIADGQCGRSHMKCQNTQGSYECQCNAGYEREILDEDQPQLTVTSCVNVNECERPDYQRGGGGAGGCHELAYCVDSDGSFECHCLIGYTGNGTHCYDENDFCHEESGQPKRHNCDANGQCEINLVLAPGSFICTCNAGYEGDGIDPSSDSTSMGCNDIDECNEAVGVTRDGVSQVRACSQYGVCNNTLGSFECECDAGYIGDGLDCQACAPGFHKGVVGNNVIPNRIPPIDAEFFVWEECHMCLANTYTNGSGATACLECPSNSISNNASGRATDCVCNAAFTGPDGGPCLACAAGTYKGVNGSSQCLACNNFSDSPVQSMYSQACVCNKGYIGPDGGVCTACAPGTYKDVNGSTTQFGNRCISCPAFSSSPSGSPDASACECEPGFVDDFTHVAISRKSMYTSVAQKALAYNDTFIFPLQYTGLGITRRTSSRCEAFDDSEVIYTPEQCQNAAQIIFNAFNVYDYQTSTFTWGGSLNTTSQPAGCVAINQTAFFNLAQLSNASCSQDSNCLCLDTRRHQCYPCSQGSYNPYAGFGQECLLCPENTTSLASSTSIQQCECERGYFGQYHNCTPCAFNTFKSSVGSEACTSCPSSSSTKLDTRTNFLDCYCNPGFEGVNASMCAACPANTYKTTLGDHKCSACPLNNQRRDSGGE